MEITKEIIENYNIHGCECKLLKPNKQYKIGEGYPVKLVFQVMRNGKVQFYSKTRQTYHQSCEKSEIFNLVSPVNPDGVDLINYLLNN